MLLLLLFLLFSLVNSQDQHPITPELNCSFPYPNPTPFSPANFSKPYYIHARTEWFDDIDCYRRNSITSFSLFSYPSVLLDTKMYTCDGPVARSTTIWDITDLKNGEFKDYGFVVKVFSVFNEIFVVECSKSESLVNFYVLSESVMMDSKSAKEKVMKFKEQMKEFYPFDFYPKIMLPGGIEL